MKPRDLSDHVPYRAGRGITEVARELGLNPDDLHKLSSNENPFGPSPRAVEAIVDAAESVHTYPKAAHTDLVEALAETWALDPVQVWLTPGGDGFLDYLARAFLDSGDRVLVPEPGFAYYAMSAHYRDAGVDQYHLSKHDGFEQTAETILEAYDDHRIIYVTTPHNPSGSEMTLDEIETLTETTNEDTLVVVDEAYGEFTSNSSARQLLDERDDVAVLRTFSKAYGLAGLRLGYGLVPRAWASAYERVNTPFAVNAPACYAGLAALDDDDHVERTVETVHWARTYIRETLGAPTWESGGNFVLAEVGNAKDVTEQAQRKGTIIRDCTSFGLSECIRVSCGTKETTTRAVATLNEVLDG